MREIYQPQNKRKAGFTLVELSIVLVIIGLLIGGILVAQSLIDSSKVQSQIRQIDQFDAAVSTFISKYRSWPGDSSKFGCATSYCDNGIITDTVTAGANLLGTSRYRNEVGEVWVNLQQTGLKNDRTFTATVPVAGFNTGTEKNAPKAILGEGDSSVLLAASRPTGTTYYNYYQISDYSALTSATVTLSANMAANISPIENLSVDSKIDDGLPYSGDVRVSGATYYGHHSGTPATCVSASQYVKSETPSCRLVIKALREIDQ